MSRARLARLPLVLAPAALALGLVVTAPALVAGDTFVHVLPWAPSAGLETALRLDALSGLFALIVVILTMVGAHTVWGWISARLAAAS